MITKLLLKCWLFTMIIILELFLQFGLLIVLLTLCFWVLILIIITSPLWIPLAICWAPATIFAYLAFKHTSVSYFYLLLLGWWKNLSDHWEHYNILTLPHNLAQESNMEDILQCTFLVRTIIYLCFQASKIG